MTQHPNIRRLVGHISDRPQKRAGVTFGIRRGDCGLGGGVPARSHLSLRAIARTFGGTLDALAAWDYKFTLAIQALLPAGRAVAQARVHELSRGRQTALHD